MKKIFIICLVSIISIGTSWGNSEHNIQSANFLALKGVINDQSSNILEYNLELNVTRREMLKVMMNMSGKDIIDVCNGDFNDIASDDWGCKYAEAALKEGYIAQNESFRPNDNVSQIEALKMIMQAQNIVRDDNEDWRAGYVSKAESQGIIHDSYFIYDTSALRGWIFSRAASTFSDFNYSGLEGDFGDIPPDIEEFLNNLGI